MNFPGGAKSPKKQSEGVRFLLIRHLKYSAISTDCLFGDFDHWINLFGKTNLAKHFLKTRKLDTLLPQLPIFLRIFYRDNQEQCIHTL